MLSDEDKKRDYDTFGMAGSGQGPGASPGAEWARQTGNMGQ